MILAEIYAERLNLKFIVNSYYWNCRYKDGLRDYFENGIFEQNCIFSAQVVRNKSCFNFKIVNFHTLFYNINYILNNIYLYLHKEVLFGADIYNELRADSFLNSIDKDEYLIKVRKCLQLKKTILNEFDIIYDKLGIDRPFVGIHIRRGDKITTGEMDKISLDRYINEIMNSKYETVYIASDDISSINYIKRRMQNMNVNICCNPNLEGKGFNEGDFNHTGKRKRYEKTLTLLFDIYMLSKASYFVGTYSSNLSRVIPCILGFENCKSLDENWHVG